MNVVLLNVAFKSNPFGMHFNFNWMQLYWTLNVVTLNADPNSALMGFILVLNAAIQVFWFNSIWRIFYKVVTQCQEKQSICMKSFCFFKNRFIFVLNWLSKCFTLSQCVLKKNKSIFWSDENKSIQIKKGFEFTLNCNNSMCILISIWVVKGI